MHTFILVIPRFEDIYHSYYAGEIIKGVGLAASRLKVDILLHITDRNEHLDWLEITDLHRYPVDGILFADINGDLEMLNRVISKGIPYIVLNNTFTEPINSIAIDNEQAAFNVVRRLIEYGHRRVATITGDLLTQSGKLRLAGYKRALKENNLPVIQDYIAVGDYLRTPARQAAKHLLNMEKRPTAIFCASDVMALELIDTAREMGIKVPDDLSIVGFDDNPLSNASALKLSTVSQPLVEMGRLALEHLNQIVNKRSSLPIKIVLGSRYIERDSLRPLTANMNSSEKGQDYAKK